MNLKTIHIDINKPIRTDKKYKVLSLFAGCGGMDLGFQGGFTIFGEHYSRNNFDIVYANEIEKKATETYEYNFNHEPICADIRDIDETELPQVDIVIGGFPCQDFSMAGKRRGLDSERGKLYLEMKRVIKEIRPKMFVAENVDGIRKSKMGEDTSALDIILEDFREMNYTVQYKLLNAADYGVPQARKRVIIIGKRNDIAGDILYPEPVRGEGKDTPYRTAKEGIDDLWDKIDTGIPNHTLKDYSKAKFYPGKKMQGNNKIDAERPSCTIRAEHHGNIEAHYRSKEGYSNEDVQGWRRLSVRECARLQSFPDDFIFPVTATHAYRQIGNAVPPILGWYIANAIYCSLTSDYEEYLYGIK